MVTCKLTGYSEIWAEIPLSTEPIAMQCLVVQYVDVCSKKRVSSPRFALWIILSLRGDRRSKQNKKKQKQLSHVLFPPLLLRFGKPDGVRTNVQRLEGNPANIRPAKIENGAVQLSLVNRPLDLQF